MAKKGSKKKVYKPKSVRSMKDGMNNILFS